MKINLFICALLLPCALFAQSKGIDVPLQFVSEDIEKLHRWNYVEKIVGNADKCQSEYISQLKDPKILEVKFSGFPFQFVVGFDKKGNKWIIPYNFDKYQPYANIPFVFNEDCTNEIIYLRLPNHVNLCAYTLRRYRQEEKDKNGKGTSSYGRTTFQIDVFGHYAGEMMLDSIKYDVQCGTFYGTRIKNWFVDVKDKNGHNVVTRHWVQLDPIITINKKKYLFECIDNGKAVSFHLEPLTDSLLALNKALVPPADFSRMELTALADSKT